MAPPAGLPRGAAAHWLDMQPPPPPAPHLGAVERTVEVALGGAVLAGHAAAPSLGSIAPGDVTEVDKSVKPAVQRGAQLVLQP